eukprot:54595-Eustigmatos_ZCMA.PRE.1
MEAWIRLRPDPQQALLRDLQSRWLGENNPINVGHCNDFLNRNTKMVMPTARVGMVASLCDLLAGLTVSNAPKLLLTMQPTSRSTV